MRTWSGSQQRILDMHNYARPKGVVANEQVELLPEEFPMHAIFKRMAVGY